MSTRKLVINVEIFDLWTAEFEQNLPGLVQMSCGTSHSMTVTWFFMAGLIFWLNFTSLPCMIHFCVRRSQSCGCSLVLKNTVQGRMGCEAFELQLPICRWMCWGIQCWSKQKEDTLEKEVKTDEPRMTNFSAWSVEEGRAILAQSRPGEHPLWS